MSIIHRPSLREIKELGWNPSIGGGGGGGTTQLYDSHDLDWLTDAAGGTKDYTAGAGAEWSIPSGTFTTCQAAANGDLTMEAPQNTNAYFERAFTGLRSLIAYTLHLDFEFDATASVVAGATPLFDIAIGDELSPPFFAIRYRAVGAANRQLIWDTGTLANPAGGSSGNVAGVWNARAVRGRLSVGPEGLTVADDIASAGLRIEPISSISQPSLGYPTFAGATKVQFLVRGGGNVGDKTNVVVTRHCMRLETEPS